MAIIINLDVMLARRKMSVTELSQRVGITMANISILKNGRAKMEIALAKGKALYDKREDAKLKDAKREMEKALKARW